jgi:hypothetical protein
VEISADWKRQDVKSLGIWNPPWIQISQGVELMVVIDELYVG